MPLIKDIDDLVQVLSAIAAETRVSLRCDTHYDAGNVELQWWHGRNLNRLDFQPMPQGELVVSHIRDRFPCLPRFLRWAHNAVPMFPYLAHVERSELSRLRFPVERSVVQAVVAASGA